MSFAPAYQSDPIVAILIPCYNEEATIAGVVQGFRALLPSCQIYVYDNCSTDGTRAEAESAGAEVRSESMRGKGWVVRRMFADIEADIYILVDGDGTYDPSIARKMVSMISEENLAMIVARRVPESSSAFQAGHKFGNRMFTSAVARLFGRRMTDILSGYRAFSRQFVKSIPLFSGGFEVETELTVHALTLGLPVAELPTVYRERPQGSVSKLHKYKDGIRILRTIISLFKNEKPLAFFAVLGVILFAAALLLAYPVVNTFLETGLVPRFPTAILATGLAICALILFACGVILDTVTKGRREIKRLTYLNTPRTLSSVAPKSHVAADAARFGKSF